MKPTEISPACRGERGPTAGNEHNPKIGPLKDLQLDDML